MTIEPRLPIRSGSVETGGDDGPITTAPPEEDVNIDGRCERYASRSRKDPGEGDVVAPHNLPDPPGEDAMKEVLVVCEC